MKPSKGISCYASKEEYELIKLNMEKHCQETGHHYREVSRTSGWVKSKIWNTENPTKEIKYYICIDCGYKG